jgi:hypothetical protein
MSTGIVAEVKEALGSDLSAAITAPTDCGIRPETTRCTACEASVVFHRAGRDPVG